jgi:hypothetical protein
MRAYKFRAYTLAPSATSKRRADLHFTVQIFLQAFHSLRIAGNHRSRSRAAALEYWNWKIIHEPGHSARFSRRVGEAFKRQALIKTALEQIQHWSCKRRTKCVRRNAGMQKKTPQSDSDETTIYFK